MGGLVALAAWPCAFRLESQVVGFAAVALLAVGSFVAWRAIDRERPDEQGRVVLAEPGAFAGAEPRLEASSSEVRRTEFDPERGPGADPAPMTDAAPRPAWLSTVTVVAHDEEARPVSGAAVALLRGEEYETVARTDESGRVSLGIEEGEPERAGALVHEGMVGVRVFAPGRAASSLWHLDPAWHPVREPGEDGRVDLQVTLVAGSSLSGRVRTPEGEGVGGARISVFLEEALDTKLFEIWKSIEGRSERTGYLFQAPLLAISDPAGRFRLDGLRPGPHRLRVTAPGFLPLEVRAPMESPGSEGIELPLKRGGRLSGGVWDPDGSPVAGARIWHDSLEVGGELAARQFHGYDPLQRGYRSSWEAGADGAFDLRGVPVPRVRLWAQDPRRPDLVASLELNFGEELEHHWNARLLPRRPLRVRAVDRAGQGLGDCEVTLQHAGSPAWIRFTRTGPDGWIPDLYDWPEGPVQIDVEGEGRPPRRLVDVRAEDGPFEVVCDHELEALPTSLSVRLRDHGGGALLPSWIRFMDGGGVLSDRIQLGEAGGGSAAVVAGVLRMLPLKLDFFAIADRRGSFYLGRHDLEEVREVVIERDAPAPGRFVPIAPETFDGHGLLHRIHHYLEDGPETFDVAIAAGEGLPEETLELFPGRGRVVVYDEETEIVVCVRSFAIHSGKDALVPLDPELSDRTPIEVIEEDGLPVEDASLRIYSREGTLVYADEGERRDTEGRWHAPLYPGSYRLEVVSDGGRLAQDFEVRRGEEQELDYELSQEDLQPVVLVLER